MASDPDFITLVTESCATAGTLTTRKMFGEYAAYLDGTLVGLICNNRFFVKATVAGRAILDRSVEESPYPQAKPAFVTDAFLDEHELLARLLVATRDELAMQAKKKPKKTATKAGKKRTS